MIIFFLDNWRWVFYKYLFKIIMYLEYCVRRYLVFGFYIFVRIDVLVVIVCGIYLVLIGWLILV